MEASDAVRGWFGPVFLEAYLRHKRSEVTHVAEWAVNELCNRYCRGLLRALAAGADHVSRAVCGDIGSAGETRPHRQAVAESEAPAPLTRAATMAGSGGPKVSWGGRPPCARIWAARSG